ncbi:MAG: hypothetical protein H7177_05910 [Rhizobacter sp.]|nr:hypothetical protein [Bacteriovorax sp.]
MNIHNEIKIFSANSNLKNLNILDLGCGSPYSYFCLFKELKEKNGKNIYYTGVDRIDEFNIFHNNNPQRLEPATYEIETKDWVNRFNGQACGDFELQDDYHIDEATFCTHFKFHFGTDVGEFILTNNDLQKYDIIILSNLLHKLNHSTAESVFDKCLTLMHADSIIYVSVLGENYNGLLPEDNSYKLERYSEMKAKIRTVNHYEDINDHLIFIGEKR